MTEQEVTISVIIPTYNRAYVVIRAIQTVLNQTYQNYELFVVDDGSTDNTREVVESIKDVRIKYIRSEKNRGPAVARNTGINAAKGKYIAFLDSDDEWLPEKLEKQMAAFEMASPQVGIVYVGMLSTAGKKETYIPPDYVRRREGNLYYDILIDPILVFPSTSMIRRECFAKVGMFDDNFRAGQDWELWIRIAKYYHFKYIDDLLVRYTISSDSISTYRRSSRIREMVLAKHREDICRDKKILSQYYVKTGHSFCFENQLERGRQYFIWATMAYPFNIEASLAYMASLLGQRVYVIAQATYKKFRGWWFSRRR